MTKKELALICIERLKQQYPLAECTLDYEHAWQLLVEVRLAAQCTDARVNVVVQDLFAKYPSVAALAAAMLVEDIVVSSMLGVTAFSAFWSIKELFEQRQRVLKGWFPKNPKRKY